MVSGGRVNRKGCRKVIADFHRGVNKDIRDVREKRGRYKGKVKNITVAMCRGARKERMKVKIRNKISKRGSVWVFREVHFDIKIPGQDRRSLVVREEHQKVANLF